VKVDKSNIIGSKPSVGEGIAETLNIHMCLTSRIFEQAGCWRSRVIFWPFQNICKLLASRIRQKISMSQNHIFIAK
jgi:hypothetical protein